MDLEGLTLKVKATYSKNRQEDSVLIRAELAEARRSWVAPIAPAAPVFNIPNRTKMIKAIYVDLAAAGIARVDPEGRHVDFHGTRHTLATSLAAGGVHPKTAQSLVRHSTITLTMDRYTHTLRGAEAAALSILPDYSTPANAETALKMGTSANPTLPQPTPPRGSNAAEMALPQGGNVEIGWDLILAKAASLNPMASKTGVYSGVCEGEKYAQDDTTWNDGSVRTRQVKNPIKHNNHGVLPVAVANAGGGGRTHTPLRALDFESSGKGLQVTVNKPLKNTLGSSGVYSGVSPDSASTNLPSDLTELVKAWPDLPPAIRAGILAMIKAMKVGGYLTPLLERIRLLNSAGGTVGVAEVHEVLKEAHDYTEAGGGMSLARGARGLLARVDRPTVPRVRLDRPRPGRPVISKLFGKGDLA
ncbi:MAG: tyrosine-type recombinase/integrase [Phycisphaerae bacterium]